MKKLKTKNKEQKQKMMKLPLAIGTTCHCIRCESDFTNRTPSPVNCPRCKSPLWNTPRTRNVKRK